MAKKTTGVPVTRDAVKKRLQDEIRGVAPSFLSGPADKELQPEEMLDISDLGLPTTVKARLEALVISKNELGEQRKQLEKTEKTYTDEIKQLMAQYVGNDKVSFRVSGIPVSQFMVPRSSISPLRLQAEDATTCPHCACDHGMTLAEVDRAKETKETLTVRVGGGRD
jgi:hypothetical protein